jgi:hypothetical protein
MLKLPDITQLQAHNPHFYRIFAFDKNNFGKIVLILPPAIIKCPELGLTRLGQRCQ